MARVMLIELRFLVRKAVAVIRQLSIHKSWKAQEHGRLLVFLVQMF